MRDINVDEEMRNQLAEKLRSVADDLESDDLKLTECPRASYVEMLDGLPQEIEINYYDRESGGERTIDIY